jgi:hypothetical protein
MTFQDAIRLRDDLQARGWSRDLLGVEAFGADVTNGRAARGFRVVLAWADGRFRRVTTLAEALRFLSGATTLDGNPPDAPGGRSMARRGLRYLQTPAPRKGALV